eukprot:g20159.t1
MILLREAPHMKSYTELEGEQGCRVPLSIGTPVEDFDKKGEPCISYDVVANPEVVEQCSTEPAFREQVVQLCLAAVAQKYKIELDARFKLPKIKYKGTSVQLQRIRKKKESQIQEQSRFPSKATDLPGSPQLRAERVPASLILRPIQEVDDSKAPMPGTSASRRAAGESATFAKPTDGPSPPDFTVYYSLPDAPRLEDAFTRNWGSPPEDVDDATKETYLFGFDLPCYRVNTFQEKIRGTMKNKALREEEEEVDAEVQAKQATREMLASRRGTSCCVQVKLPDLDPHMASLKQFILEVSDECLRLNFPMLPRSKKSAYAGLSIWWPLPFNAADARADWDPKADILTVSIPTHCVDVSAEANAHDLTWCGACPAVALMQLRYYLNGNGKRVYTLESEEKPTFSAHPARFSPDDKYSEHRIKCKKRFGVLKTQLKPEEL